MTLVERFRTARRDSRQVVLEGFHALKHAVRFGATVTDVVLSERAAVLALARELAPDLEATVEGAAEIGSARLADLVPQAPATGVVALAERPLVRPEDLLGGDGPGPVVALEDVDRLGNLGAAVRVAAAAGADGVVAVGRHDPWSPEAVRGAAGLQFALPVARADTLGESPRTLVAVTPEGDPLGSRPLPAGAILAFGNERSGLSDALRGRAALTLSIPMRAGVSSLNLATAVAVCLYWWRLSGPPGLLHRWTRGARG